MAVTAGVMGLIIGALAAWATLNLGVAAIAFIVGLLGGATTATESVSRARLLAPGCTLRRL